MILLFSFVFYTGEIFFLVFIHTNMREVKLRQTLKTKFCEFFIILLTSICALVVDVIEYDNDNEKLIYGGMNATSC